MNRRSLLLFLLSFLASSVAIAPALAAPPAKPIVLRAATNNPSQSGMSYGIIVLKKLVEERTKGRVIVEIIDDAALGDEEQLAEGMQKGTVDFTSHSSAKYANFVPEVDIYSPPYTFKNWNHMKAVTTSEVNDKLVRAVMERRGDYFVGVYTEGLRNVFTKNEIHNLDGLKGLRLRTMSGPGEVSAWRALGADPTPMAYYDINSALKAGLVDGAENTMTGIFAMKFYENAKYLLRTEHNYMAMPAILSGRFVKKLPEDLRDIVIQAAKDSASQQLDWAIEFDRENGRVLQEHYGVKITKLSKKDYEQAVSICRNFHIENAKRIGMEKEQKIIADLAKKY